MLYLYVSTRQTSNVTNVYAVVTKLNTFSLGTRIVRAMNLLTIILAPYRQKLKLHVGPPVSGEIHLKTSLPATE